MFCSGLLLSSNLDPSEVSPQELLRLIRGHWTVESHHFIKDRHWLRRPGLGRVFVLLTNTAVSVLRLLPGKKKILRARAEKYNGIQNEP